ncbi:hypothetical protein [Paenibacillus gallinarum]|uniref:Uncharacterized protein n=1 Tax=Paenibacillus gallinarum TaxID=2762232 RepID=A0ABR8T4W0_9BACL|nr:hypothetical protein [Paenibacillus gallinarum]MBD7970334.1 hypothetical protein [Paenibacillus gallinarum]
MERERQKMWFRLGVEVEVDPELFLIDPEKAINEALESGNAITDGDSYIPDSVDEDDRYDWAEDIDKEECNLNIIAGTIKIII